MIRLAFALSAFCISAAAQGQSFVSGLLPPVDPASVCQPATVVPPSETVGGAGGTASTFRRSDAVQPRITRAGLATATDTNGNWAITWSTPLATPPVTLPIPVNTGTEPIVCNVATSTGTGATGRCWLARTLPATILTLTALVNYDPFGTAAPGIMVQVLAIPVTQ